MNVDKHESTTLMTPAQLSKTGTEHGHQRALFCAIRLTRHIYPELDMAFSIPNGSERDPRVAAKLKTEGVKAGTWDIFLPVASATHHGMFLEMKKPGLPTLTTKSFTGRGKLSEKQRTFGLKVHEGGYHTAICYTWDEAWQSMLVYLGKEIDQALLAAMRRLPADPMCPPKG